MIRQRRKGQRSHDGAAAQQQRRAAAAADQQRRIEMGSGRVAERREPPLPCGGHGRGRAPAPPLLHSGLCLNNIYANKFSVLNFWRSLDGSWWPEADVPLYGNLYTSPGTAGESRRTGVTERWCVHMVLVLRETTIYFEI